MFKTVLATALCVGMVGGLAAAQPSTPEEPLGSTEVLGERWYLPNETIPADFEDDPFAYSPAVMYQLALQDFEARDGESAAYWAYMGQLRYRAHLQCDELGTFTGPFDTYQALNADIGNIVNLWLGGDIQLWVDTLTQVTNEYETAIDPFVPSPRCDQIRSRQITGARGLRQHLVDNHQDMRRIRASNGLENRTTGTVSVSDG